ncbi:MAG: hypothetical protein QOH49_3871 [Acidobacteriota bacterium]|nr:hypothetical protein [Acidobacteriota bacterium]
MKEQSYRIDSCRSCGYTDINEFLDLGLMPLANALIGPEKMKEEPRFPLVAAFCGRCSLMQITETVSPELLFGHYLYASSYSDTMLKHAEGIAKELTDTLGLGPESLVVEVASNDGYLLQYFKQLGVPILGIEPARNIATVANERGVNTRCEFFSGELGRTLGREGVAADALLANNVLAHVDDLNGFVSGVAAVLKPGGVARFEFPYVGDLLDKLEFDTIYHEHLCYFSAHAVEALLRRHNLVFTDVKRLALHGGSLRVTAAFHAGKEGRARVESLLAEEREKGIDCLDRYRVFADGVRGLAGKLKGLLHGLRSEGKRIAAYGASAKGATLLNYLNLEPGTIEYVVDRSPLKQGLLTPGTHLEIHQPERLTEDTPDYVLLLTWNFADEILEQQRAYRETGGRFIIPVPEPAIV